MPPVLVLLTSLVLGIIGGYLYRLRGGGNGPVLPRPIDQALFSLPVLTVYLLGVPVWLTVLGYVWMVVWTLTGHGGFMDLGGWLKERTRERLEFLIVWLEDNLPGYWYDALGLAVTGVVPVLITGIATLFYAWPVGVVILATGLTKALGYMFSKAVDWLPGDTDEDTERGEYSFGFSTWWLIFLSVGLYLLQGA